MNAIPGHITVRVGLGDQIAVAVVDINGTVAVVIPYQDQKGVSAQYADTPFIPFYLAFKYASLMAVSLLSKHRP